MKKVQSAAHGDTSLENSINIIASEVFLQQEVRFSLLADAERHLKKIEKDIHHIVDKSNQTLQRGLAYLSTDNLGEAHIFVAGIAAKMLRHIASSKKINKIIETDIFANEHALQLFADAVESFMDSGDLEREYCVLTVMLMLFPLNPQPYLYFAAALERSEGMEVAADYYSKAVKVLPHPVLFYFAGDCFFRLGAKAQAKQLLESGIDYARKAPELHADIATRLARFSERII